MWIRAAVANAFLAAVHVAGQCGPGGAKPYPPGKTACPSMADGMQPHNSGVPAPGPNPVPAPQAGSGAGNTCAVGPCAAALLSNVGYTTASGTDVRSGITFYPGEDIYGPFEAGFSSQQDSVLEGLGCNPGSLGYLPGGIDTKTAHEMVAHQCNVQLPRVQGSQYISLLDECGGHTKEYHFHEKLECLYKQEGTHSSKVGTAQDGQDIFGMWEDFNLKKKPALDACGGHFGITPTSNGKVIYHYHVQEKPPFMIGCFGPAKDAAGNDKLVTLAECRAVYSGCGDNDVMTVTTAAGSFKYDLWCPCFDKDGSNVGMVELEVFSSPDLSEQTTCVGTCSSFTPVAESGNVPVDTTQGGGGVPIPLVVGIAALACCCAVVAVCAYQGVNGPKALRKRGLGKSPRSEGSGSPDEEEEEPVF